MFSWKGTEKKAEEEEEKHILFVIFHAPTYPIIPFSRLEDPISHQYNTIYMTGHMFNHMFVSSFKKCEDIIKLPYD